MCFASDSAIMLSRWRRRGSGGGTNFRWLWSVTTRSPPILQLQVVRTVHRVSKSNFPCCFCVLFRPPRLGERRVSETASPPDPCRRLLPMARAPKSSTEFTGNQNHWPRPSELHYPVPCSEHPPHSCHFRFLCGVQACWHLLT